MTSFAVIQSVLLLIKAAIATAAELEPIAYSGTTSWDPATGTLRFCSGGAMPETKEGFYFQVPEQVRRIVISAGVTVRGGFRIPFRQRDNPLGIIGEDRETSVIFGTDVEGWTTSNQIAENDKWRYGAINVLADALVHVSNLTSKNPRSYHISGYANESVLHVSQCNLLDTRKGDNNNSDGFIGASGSSIADSFISTSDDGIKIYHDMTVRNVTIEQRRNGAPIQFGWGGSSGSAKATILNLTIKGIDPGGRYNMAPFTWEAGTAGQREVIVKGLQVNVDGVLYDERRQTWRKMGLFELKPPGCSLNLTITDAQIRGLDRGIRNTQGVISVNGNPW
ncbi:hypothetical protein EG834_14755 [bacterium]|nr:hypothetical protein [bacterium]